MLYRTWTSWNRIKVTIYEKRMVPLCWALSMKFYNNILDIPIDTGHAVRFEINPKGTAYRLQWRHIDKLLLAMQMNQFHLNIQFDSLIAVRHLLNVGYLPSQEIHC